MPFAVVTFFFIASIRLHPPKQQHTRLDREAARKVYIYIYIYISSIMMMRVLNSTGRETLYYQMLVLVVAIVVLLASSCDVEGYSTTSHHQSSSSSSSPSPRVVVDVDGHSTRRSWMKMVAVNSIMSSSIVIGNVANAVAAEDGAPTTTTATKTKTQGVISSKYCAYGEGNDCSDLAEGNPLILELQRRSSANKDKIITDAQNAYYNKNYPDFMKAVGKTMVQKLDGGFVLLDDSEVSKLKQEGKITLAYPKTMNGKFTDLTQKPIPVMKE